MPHDDSALPASHPLDALSAARDHHDVVLENRDVRVLDTRLRPGERTPVHVHEWPAVLHVLSFSHFVRYDPEGRVLVDSRTLAQAPAAGSILWAAPLPPHFVHNVGESELHVVAIEIKAPAPGRP